MPADPSGGAAETGPGPVAGLGSGVKRLVGQERGEVGAHATGPTPGPPAPMGDAERLVEVEVRDVGTEMAGPGEAHHGVEVGAVQVDLPPAVHDVAETGDARLENAVGGRIGDHQAGEPLAGSTALALRSSTSTLPWSSHARPRRAGRPSPRSPRSCRARTRGSGTRRARASPAAVGGSLRIARRPGYSPCDPAFGCSEIAS